MKLEQKIFLKSTLLMFFLIVVSFCFTSYLLFNNYRDNQLYSAKTEAQTLVLSSEKFILWHEYSELNKLMESAVNINPLVEYIFIIKDQNVIAHTFINGVPEALLSNNKQIIGSGQSRLFKKENGEVFWDITATGKGVDIQVHFGVSESKMIKHSLQWILSLAFIFFIVYLASILLSYSFAIILSKEERNQTKALIKTQDYLTSVFDSMPSILVTVDLKGIITNWNKKASQITGKTEEEAIAQPLDTMLPYYYSVIDEIFNAIEKGEEYTIFKHHRLEEENRHLIENVTVYPLHGIEIKGAVIRIDDITHEQLLQEKLNHSQKMDAIGQMAGGIAHDFNNMLGGIIGATDLLKSSDCVCNTNALKLIKMINDAAEKAASLTSKLLTFGRKEESEAELVDVHKIIDDTNALFSRTIDKKIKITIEKNAVNTQVLGNSSSLQNSLLNLGINASHAMENGGDLFIKTENVNLNEEDCNISHCPINPGKYICITVKDTGCGIPKAYINKIFEPFFTTKAKNKGTGLGLASVYGAIQDHHGDIKVKSEMGKGTEFRIFLPCSESVTESSHAKHISFQGSGTVLVVDDEEFIRITSQHALERMGFSVITAKNGAEALNIFRNQHSEIVFVMMDMIMPIMNGKETFHEMRKIDKHCKIILVSGFIKDEDLEELIESGLTAFLKKPFRHYELGKILRETFHNSSLEKQNTNDRNPSLNP